LYGIQTFHKPSSLSRIGIILTAALLFTVLSVSVVLTARAATETTTAKKEPIYTAHDQTFSALNPADGSPLWERTFDVRIEGSTEEANGRIYLSLISGDLLAISARDGHLLWQSTVIDSAATGYSLLQPLVDRSTVVVGASDGTLRAFATNNGSMLWSTHSPVCTEIGTSLSTRQFEEVHHSLSGPQTITVSDGTGISAFDKEPSTESCLLSLLQIVNGTLYAYSGLTGGLLAVQVADGAILWLTPDIQFEPLHRGFEVVGRNIYVPFPGKGTAVLSVTDGTLQRILPLSSSEVIRSSFVAWHHTLYVLESSATFENNTLSTYRLGSTEQLLWQKPLESDVSLTSLSVVNDSIYAASSGMLLRSDGVADEWTDVYAFQAKDATPLWHWHLDTAEGIDTPKFASGLVIARTFLAAYALDPRTGTVNWQSQW
jgi:outer membrane protein assembly factor BamB